MLITFFNLIRFIYKKVVDLNIIKNKQKKTTMKTEIETTKKIMNLLLECVKDKNISIKERNVYYSEYLQLAKNLLVLSK